ncbi:hypothetical protein [Rhodopseudomonas sp.]|uniref:hypothetical protein n=1 Tax=Rhodopseudomonas sp. TaxID=1078 RepID=UPI0039E5350C
MTSAATIAATISAEWNDARETLAEFVHRHFHDRLESGACSDDLLRGVAIVFELYEADQLFDAVQTGALQ